MYIGNQMVMRYCTTCTITHKKKTCPICKNVSLKRVSIPVWQEDEGSAKNIKYEDDEDNKELKTS